MTPRLGKALRAWRRALGAARVVTDAGALRAATTATFRTSQRVVAILRPRSRAGVQRCLRIANRFRVPLHPVSRGRNWGYGSRVPVLDGCALLDLSRLNRIVAFDERLGYATIEPGVTFRALHRFLRARRSRLRANPTGSTPDSSPLANALERGLGQGPLGDRFASLCGLEVVLPTGALLRTGFARFRGAKAAPLHRWGVGPSVDGLFSQSNLGVVTRATLWLTPMPDHADLYAAKLGSGIAGTIDALRPLFLSGAVRSPVKLTNDYRSLSVRMRYPWSIMGDASPLTRETVRRLIPRPARWLLSGVLEHATPRHRAATRRLVREALGRAVSFRTIRAEARGGIHRPESGFDVAATYWRKRAGPPRRMDPDRDLCGAIWCSPVVPLVGREVARAVRIVERATAEAGFEPMMTITVLDGRTAHLVAPVLFDRAVPGEDGRALACARRMLVALAREGFYPYRLGVNSMRLLAGSRSGDGGLRRALKRAVDPRGILSPGRYEA